MTKEEALRILDPKTFREATRGMSLNERIKASDEAESIAVAALRAQLEMENPRPLEWYELIFMEGCPVWVVDTRTGEGFWSIIGDDWCISIRKEWGAVCWRRPQGEDCVHISVYGKRYLAYLYRPGSADPRKRISGKEACEYITRLLREVENVFYGRTAVQKKEFDTSK